MRVENGQQSNAILGGGQASAGRDASKFDPPRPGFGWLVNPFAGVTDLARSFDLDEDERGEITMLLEKAAKIREKAGRLAGQWDDPIERHLLNATGLSSAAGGPKRDGVPGRNTLNHSPEQRQQMDALRGCLIAMNDLGRDVAQVKEMAELIGGGMTEVRLGKLLRDGGAGGTVKVDIEGVGRVNGYQRADIADALKLLEGN
jgi:S-DNA-T family DNA segregation ATPase FtsK/SpoIIIE